MKLIAVLVALGALLLLSSGVLAGNDNEARPAKHMAVKTKKARTKTVRTARLALPNVAASVRSLQRTERRELEPQIRKSRQVIAFFRNPRHHWMLATRHEKCWQVPWQRECTIARANVRLQKALAKSAKKLLWYELPATHDWRTAVQIAQRAYPGTESWMLYISQREGGYGQWVWYGGRQWSGYHVGNDFLGADTVGGWMQFRYSTFSPYWRQAQEDLQRRGYKIPSLQMPPEGGPTMYVGWLSPLGQALTAGYMRYYGKDACHWCL